jgi:hypothetical protein
MRSNGGMDQAIALIVAALLATSSAAAADRIELTQLQMERPQTQTQAQTETRPAPGCAIKGSIFSSGDRIYQVPGGEYYAATRINPAKGERWFCSEAEAIAAGWRRSKR